MVARKAPSESKRKNLEDYLMTKVLQKLNQLKKPIQVSFWKPAKLEPGRELQSVGTETRRILAEVLAEKIESGFLTEKAALQIARRVHYANAIEVYNLGKSSEQARLLIPALMPSEKGKAK